MKPATIAIVSSTAPPSPRRRNAPPNNPHKATPNSLWGGSVFDANPGSGFGANQQSLHLIDNAIGRQGIAALAKNTSLSALAIRYNLGGLSNADVNALAKNTTLRSLHIGGNPIGDAGAYVLAANTTLAELDVRFSEIGSAGTQALAANASLKSLNITGNKIGIDGLRALGRNTALESLTVAVDWVGAHVLLPFAENTTLKELNFKSRTEPDVFALSLSAAGRNMKVRVDPNMGEGE
ncbi:hypothetical protein ACN9M1_20720 [Ralstonia sp. R-29]|uniref:hypothetical protein n=1 Tax=Ralstonia sp. R-29 TaxID=3404059 RepID=UPI003CFB5E1B